MDFVLQARRVLFLPCQSDRMRHTQDTFYIYWKTGTSWCFLCSAERAAASIFRAKRHKAHNDFGRNESTQRRKTHGEMKMVSNWLHFFGVAKPRHGSTLWLSHTAKACHNCGQGRRHFPNKRFEFTHTSCPPLHYTPSSLFLSLRCSFLHFPSPTFSLPLSPQHLSSP